MIRAICLSFISLLLMSCESLDTVFTKPQLDVVKVKLIPQAGFEQTVRVDFRLTNPNAYTLPLNNLSYHLSLDSHKLINGSTNQLSSVDANSSKQFSVDAQVNLLRGALWLKNLIDSDAQKVNYKVKAELDTGLSFAPDIEMQHSGKIRLTH